MVSGSMTFGTFFPTILFFTLLSLVVLPVTPYGSAFTQLVKNPYSWQNNGVIALVALCIILVLTVMLYQLNTALIRLYEGYPWEGSWIGEKWKKRRQRHFDLAGNMKERVANLAREVGLEKLEIDSGSLADVTDMAGDILDNEYPNKRELVLPTRLGNVIRAFETYTERRYGASQLALWSRLQAVIDPAYMEAINSAKTEFDFMLNSSFLSAVLAFLLLCAGLIWRHPRSYGLFQAWEFEVVLFTGVSHFLYLGAINRAAEWGLGVKSSFDLYRLALLKKLGYESVPADLMEERKMWDVISYHFAFPTDEIYPELPYKARRTSLSAEPVQTVVTFRRTVTVLDDDVVQVRVVISNTDPSGEDASAVTLQEETPPESTYVKDSAMVDGAPAVLLSSDPLKVEIGPLPYSEARTVVYQWKKQEENK